MFIIIINQIISDNNYNVGFNTFRNVQIVK